MEKHAVEWLSLEEAGAYLKIGKTALYAMAREGRIPASKVRKKWTFDRAQLDLWVKNNQPIENYFESLDFNIENNRSLREPQREGYLKTAEFFAAGKNKAILQIPVGCGKTGLASILPMGIAKGRVLVVAPNLTIKDSLYEAMDITNRPKCFWRKAGILSDVQMTVGAVRVDA